MKLCIFEAGLPPEELQSKFDRYPVMIRDWLAPSLPEARFSYTSIVTGQDFPKIGDFDGYLITGSKYGVYENLPWMAPLKEFLLACKKENKPVFGICFGHQIMAEAYGGKVEKSSRGWQIGPKEYQYKARVMPDGASHAFHQDQVVEMPPEARLVGVASECAFPAFEYAFPAMSVQYHPEFKEPYMKALIDHYVGGKVPPEVGETIEPHEVDNTECAEWAARFFRKALTGKR